MDFKEHQEYNIIPIACTGKRKAFEKGWKAKELGNSENPYDPRVKHFMPTNPYFKYWQLGFDSCHKTLNKEGN